MINFAIKSFFCSFLVFNIFFGFVFPNTVLSETGKNQYYEAEKLYNNFINETKKQEYREEWLLCIKEYNKVYTLTPDGPWAAAGLYKSGLLYFGLYKKLGLDSDILETVDILRRIKKRFPKSIYYDKARLLFKLIYSSNFSNLDFIDVHVDLDDKLELANIAFDQFIFSLDYNKNRNYWFEIIKLYECIYDSKSDNMHAEEAVFMLCGLCLDLYYRFNLADDKKKCGNYFIKFYKSHFEKDFFQKFVRIIRNFKKRIFFNDFFSDQYDRLKNITQKNIKIQNFSIRSNSMYTRVAINLEKEIKYFHKVLKKQGSLDDDSKYLCIDLSESSLRSSIKKYMNINDDLLSSIKITQYDDNTVRVILDVKFLKTYDIFLVKNPCKLVLDIYEKNKKIDSNFYFSNEDIQDNIAHQLSLGIKKIIIDPGHGGKDYGAIGVSDGIYEKDIVLQISLFLASKIKQELTCDVILTRDDDYYISLDERTKIANKEAADLFISIHTNASDNNKVYGIETFYLDLATDNDAALVAVRENLTSKNNMKDLKSILSNIMHNSKINESSRLALSVQESLYLHMSRKYDSVISKGVKQAPFYVLMGVEMPAILIETSFISNKRECERLNTSEYQHDLCNGIVEGIKKYIIANKN